jgi:hypothetical protein
VVAALIWLNFYHGLVRQQKEVKKQSAEIMIGSSTSG